MNTQEKYSELISLTQLYLAREYKGKAVCLASPATYSFFQARIPHKPSKPLPMSIPLPVPLPLPEKLTPSSNNFVNGSNPVPVSEKVVAQIIIETPRSNSGTGTGTGKDMGTFTNSAPNLKRKQLALEPLTPPQYQMDHSLKELIAAKFPELQIHESIPDDAVARKMKNGWQKQNSIPPVLILTFNQDERQMAFLKNIAKAITLCLAPARVISGLKIEAEKKWDKLIETEGVKLIIACDYGFFLQPSLKPHFKEDPKQGKHSLGPIPLLLLSDLDLYLQQPQLKPLLWQAICKELR